MIALDVQNNSLFRILIIAAAFLTVTLALILLQPGVDGAAQAPADETPALALDSTAEQPAEDSVARADASLLGLPQSEAENTLLNDALAQTEVAAVAPAPAVDAITASVLASLRHTEPATKPVAAAPNTENDQLRNLTSNVLSGLAGTTAQTSQKSMQSLVVQALQQGQSDSYIEALINEAADAGTIQVPSALRTSEGQVDTTTLLAELVRKSDPESSIPQAAVVSGEGVEVRVVQRAGETRQYNFYTVQRGDSLGAIAHRFYGDAALYKTIFDANRQFLSSPDTIRVGQRITIPAVTES